MGVLSNVSGSVLIDSVKHAYLYKRASLFCPRSMPLTTMGTQFDDCVPISVFAKSMLTNYLKFSVRGNIPICIFSTFLAEILPF